MSSESAEADHFVQYTTPRGSVVVMPNLTAAQRDEIAATFSPGDTPTPASLEGKGESQSCGQCGGAGYWMETVTTVTPSGSEVTTQKRVNCRQCGGTGQVPA
ncbi:hypothetical protein ACIBG8_13220 [Nonomuraea sp. NPDC050556]|uniref:hypothetical protein n=1 Tax=Nonomuraea sp. NPDC050556 TaxID=3364369 RepID=UPI0037960E80